MIAAYRQTHFLLCWLG